VAGKRVLARLVVEGITTGKVTFPGEETPSTIGVKDWIEFVKWAYQYLEPPVTRNEITGADGGPVEVKTIDNAVLSKLLPELANGDETGAAKPAE
jgi:hypothetical protein